MFTRLHILIIFLAILATLSFTSDLQSLAHELVELDHARARLESKARPTAPILTPLPDFGTIPPMPPPPQKGANGGGSDSHRTEPKLSNTQDFSVEIELLGVRYRQVNAATDHAWHMIWLTWILVLLSFILVYVAKLWADSKFKV